MYEILHVMLGERNHRKSFIALIDESCFDTPDCAQLLLDCDEFRQKRAVHLLLERLKEKSRIS